MSGSINENQDQRNNNCTEDSAMTNCTEDSAMTIEFLRVRLLSERSVSKAARQRVAELAKRVEELEEQLKIVSLQRKKAEKATADVLAILEHHGISDASEEFDSNSDQEDTICESNNSNDLMNGEEYSSVSARDTGIYSSSQIESFPSTGRSLSWKSDKHSPNSFEQKTIVSARRRYTCPATNGSSPKRTGKSCRRIRNREIRSTVEVLRKDSSISHGDSSTACSGDLPNSTNSEPKTLEQDSHRTKERDPLHIPVLGVTPRESQVAADLFDNSDGLYGDMEGALKHQEQLIGRYEAEEKSQREWEEKFRETTSCSPDSFDHGNHSDVTEERDDVNATEQPCSATAINSPNPATKSNGADTCSGEEVRRLVPQHVNMSLQENEYNRKISRDSSTPDRGVPSSGLIDYQLQSGNHTHISSNLHEAVSSSCSDNSSQKIESSGSRWRAAPIPHQNANNVESILEALEQAKFSLKQKLDRTMLVEGRSLVRSEDSLIPATHIRDRVEIPAGCPALFRLPFDIQATSKANFLASPASGLSLSGYYPENGGREFYSSPYMEPKSSTFAGCQFPTSSTGSAESVSGKNLMKKSYMSTIDASLPPSSRFADLDLPFASSLTFPFKATIDVSLLPSSRITEFDLQGRTGLPFSSKVTYPGFRPDIAPQLPFSQGSPSIGKDVGVNSATHLSFYDEYKGLPPRTRLSYNGDHNVS